MRPTLHERETQENVDRHALAFERQWLWSELGEHGVKLSEDARRRITNRITVITRKLNGHAYDLDRFSELRPHEGTGGGFYEQKRWDRLELEVHEGTHEWFLDKWGDRRFKRDAKDPGNSYQGRLRVEKELLAMGES